MERRTVEVPAGVWELDWLRSRLVEEAAALGTDVSPTTTPTWSYLRSSVDGLPGDASITVTANLSVGQRTATVTVSERRSTSPSGDGR